MNSFGDKIRKLREHKKLPLHTVAAYLNIDQAILSKIERGQRKASREQVVMLAKYFKVKKNELIIAWLSDKLVYEVEDEKSALEALQAAEEKIAYRTKPVSKEKVIKEIRKYLTKDNRVTRAWLFGSYARGEHDLKSDVDLMIEVPLRTKFSLFDLSEIQYQLQQKIFNKIDIVMREAVKPNMMERIKNDLTLVYER